MNLMGEIKPPGKVVLITRPRHQADEFAQLIENNRGTALLFPSIETQAIEINRQLASTLRSLNDFELIIFISANAVNYTASYLQQIEREPYAIESEVAVIGQATAAAVVAAGFRVSVEPTDGFNSEALLKMPGLQKAQVEGRKVLIIRGEGGRNKLSEVLTGRGAIVSYAEVYRRTIPEHDLKISRQQLSEQWAKMAINTITVTSNESLQNLYDMLEEPGKSAMLGTHLIVPSMRCYELAQALGFTALTIAESATNQDMAYAVFNS